MLFAVCLMAIGFGAGFVAARMKYKHQPPQEPAPEVLKTYSLYDTDAVINKTRSSSIRMESLMQNLYSCLLSRRQTEELKPLVQLASGGFLQRYEKTAQTFHDGITKPLVESLDMFGQQRLTSAFALFETIQDDLMQMSKHMLPLLLHAQENTFLCDKTIRDISRLMEECMRRLDKVDQAISSTIYGGTKTVEYQVDGQNLMTRLRALASRITPGSELEPKISQVEALLEPITVSQDKRHTVVLDYYVPSVLYVLETYLNQTEDGQPAPEVYKLLLRAVDNLISILDMASRQNQEEIKMHLNVEVSAMERFAQMKGDLAGSQTTESSGGTAQGLPMEG